MSEELQYEKSCGAVVYCRKDNEIKYLLACECSGYWVFPKGHMEAEESEYDTALMDYEMALDTLQFDSFKRILTQAHQFLEQNRKIL